MKTEDLSDSELIAYSGEHLLYELQYFLVTAKELARHDKPSPMVSVLIESFGIHLRNLIDFFYTPRAKEDDVIASDFCPRWNETISSTLKAAKERANKELNHLTLQRTSGFDPSKPWDVVGLFNEVSGVAKAFAGRAPQTKLSPEVPKWLNSYHGNIMPVGGVAVLASNTTTSMTTSFATTSVSWGGASLSGKSTP
jgi:hypothetical protein